MERLPFLPHWDHLLRNGLSMATVDKPTKVVDRTGERPEWDRRSFEQQSTKWLISRLLIEAKSQGVWSPERVLAELLDPDNLGGGWLRRQDDPVAVFAQMWANAYQHKPRWSVEQATTIVMTLAGDEPGVQLRRIREVVGGNRGHLDDLLDGLIVEGALREVRTHGPGGGVTSRRFRVQTPEVPAKVGKLVARAVSLSLLGLTVAATAAATQTAKGHKTSVLARPGQFSRLLVDKRWMRKGIREFRKMAKKTRRRLRDQSDRDKRANDPVLQREDHRQAAGAEFAHLLDGGSR